MQRPSQPPPTIAGFRDLVPIATGGFSTVYTAFQESLGRTVAVKVLDADTQDPAARQRFQHECELTGRLTGRAHVITVFAAGTTQDDRFFIAMQYLPNGSLAERLATRGPVPAPEVVRIGMAVASALGAAHAAGILHRDIKPGNILVSDQGEPVLSDFGIASLLDPTGRAHRVDAFTRDHTAPEVLSGQPPSVQSDVYAVGSTLYTLLTGAPPVAGSSVEHLPQPDVPAGLEAVLRRTLSVDPRQRPVSAAELGGLLAGMLGLPAPAAPAPDTVAPSSVSSPVLPAAASGYPASGYPASGYPASGYPAAGPVGSASLPAVEEPTRLRAGRVLPDRTPGPVARSRRKIILGVTIAVVAVVAAAGTAFATINRGGDPSTGTNAESTDNGAATLGTARPASSASGASPVGGQGPGGSAGPGSGSGGSGSGNGSGGGAAPGTTASNHSTPAQTPATKPSTAKPPATPAPPTVCTTGGCAGRAYFATDGDHLWVCDDKSDGLGVRVQYTRTDVPLQNNDATNTLGAGKCLDHNMNMPVGTKLTFRVCLRNASDVLTLCSAYLTITN